MLPLPGCEKPSVVRIIIHYPYENLTAGQQMHLGVCAACVIQYASMRDRRTYSLREKEECAHYPEHGSPVPQHVVREGFLA
jgi:hypothetical protein